MRGIGDSRNASMVRSAGLTSTRCVAVAPDCRVACRKSRLPSKTSFSRAASLVIHLLTTGPPMLLCRNRGECQDLFGIVKGCSIRTIGRLRRLNSFIGHVLVFLVQLAEPLIFEPRRVLARAGFLHLDSGVDVPGSQVQ